MLRVYLVAPRSDLEWVDSEVDAIASMDGLRVRLVRSPATLRGVTEKIERYGAGDILVFSAHGNGSGVVLDDGQIGITDILMLVEASRCELVILNSCTSVAIASQIVKRTRASVIATIEELPDRRAWQISTGFLREVVRGGTPLSAFQRTAAHDDNSIFLRSLIE